MRVVTWNLWWRFGPHRDRQPAIASVLAGLDADVILLQEVYRADGEDQVEVLARTLDRHGVATVDDDGERTAFGNAVLSRWPIIGVEQRNLPGLDGRPGHRNALRVEIDHPDGPQVVVTTHLDWRYDASALREAQLSDLLGWLAERAPTGEIETIRPLILGGDLNALPESDEVRRLVGLSPGYLPDSEAPMRVFTDCWAAVGDGPGITWTRANPHSADALWPERRLDYVLVAWPRTKPDGNPRRAMLAGTEAVDGVVPSDHYAVVVDLDDRNDDPGPSHD